MPELVERLGVGYGKLGYEQYLGEGKEKEKEEREMAMQ